MTTSMGRVNCRNIRNYISADFAANPRDPKAKMVLFFFRLCQLLMGGRENPRRISIPAVLLYRLTTEFILGIELRPKTRVGPGLSIFHGFGLVVNDNAIIGSHVQLRNGVTIGHNKPGGGSPIIGDYVSVGAGAMLIGNIDIGIGATVGAGAVVVRDVPPRAVAVGNPARVLAAVDEK